MPEIRDVGSKGFAPNPKETGTALFRTRGRPCIKSMKLGTVSLGLDFKCFTTQPIAGRPPIDFSLFRDTQTDTEMHDACHRSQQEIEGRRADRQSLNTVASVR